jgi:hypothetical protein
MYRSLSFIIVLGAVGMGAAMPAMAQYLPPTANLLLRYDIDQNGIVSRAEMDSGVNADYALADADGSSCISGQEIRAENDRRLNRDGGVASPIADWNLDGCVNMNEFGSSIRNYFVHADRSRDGQVGSVELSGPSMPLTLPTSLGGGQQSAPTAAQQGTSSYQYDPNAPAGHEYTGY